MNTEPQELGRYAPVSEMLILAAVERAQRHRKRVGRGYISHHLGFEHSGATTRRLRPELESLRVDGSLKTKRESGMEFWALSTRGKRRLAAARRAGKVEQLPESPQHRTWRHAREEAGRREEEIREALSDAFEEASEVLHRTGAAPPSADRLFDLSKRLQSEFQRLGIATYCLHEWAEPDDSRKDLDEGPKRGPAHARRDYRSLGRKTHDS
jgi:hypothetical protein